MESLGVSDSMRPLLPSPEDKGTQGHQEEDFLEKEV